MYTKQGALKFNQKCSKFEDTASAVTTLRSNNSVQLLNEDLNVYIPIIIPFSSA